MVPLLFDWAFVRRQLLRPLTGLLFLALVLGVACPRVEAQPDNIVVPSGLTPEQAAKFQEHMRKRRGKSPKTAPVSKNDGEKKENKPEEANKEEKKNDSADTIKRPTDRPVEYDPNRVKLTPDEQGRVQFNYLGQPWTDVLQDYADAAGYTLDWLELPGRFSESDYPKEVFAR